LPIDWEAYLRLPLHVRRVMFDELNDIRKEAETQNRGNRKAGIG